MNPALTAFSAERFVRTIIALAKIGLKELPTTRARRSGKSLCVDSESETGGFFIWFLSIFRDLGIGLAPKRRLGETQFFHVKSSMWAVSVRWFLRRVLFCPTRGAPTESFLLYPFCLHPAISQLPQAWQDRVEASQSTSHP